MGSYAAMFGTFDRGIRFREIGRWFQYVPTTYALLLIMVISSQVKDCVLVPLEFRNYFS